MESLELLFKTNTDMIDMLYEMVRQIRRQNFNRADRLLRIFLPEFGKMMTDVLSPEFDCYEMADLDMRANIVTGMLKEIMACQEEGDYILLADLIELDMLPFMINIQDAVRSHVHPLGEGPAIAGYAFDKETGAYVKKVDGRSYVLEQTSQGAFTLKITDKSHGFYLHSNISPTDEGRSFAEQYYELNGQKYLIIGLGLGYHVKALCDKCHGVPVTVYESDREIFELNEILGSLSAYKEKGLNIVFDPDHKELLRELGGGEGYILAIHYPSIRLIENDDIRARMQELFVQDSSIRGQLPEMTANFHRNIKYCRHYVDELWDMFRGKSVYIAAAGPSLDENLELLKEASADKDSLIIVVGTAFRKLTSDPDIKPDLAIVLDASERIYKQVEGLTLDRTPFIICSTACADIGRDMPGEKYLVCQKGFAKAEGYAKANKLRTYESGGSVATLAFDIALRLKAARIIMAGLDLAYPDNKMHATGTSVRNLSDDGTGLIEVASNDGGRVYTTTAMNMYRRWFEKRIREAFDEMGDDTPRIINLSKRGALIKGMQKDL